MMMIVSVYVCLPPFASIFVCTVFTIIYQFRQMCVLFVFVLIPNSLNKPSYCISQIPNNLGEITGLKEL